MTLSKIPLKRKNIKIAIVNQKGGVAKTTSVISLGGCMAQAGYKVLIVDMDQQGNASGSFVLPEDNPTIMDFLIEPENGIQAFEVSPNLFILPERRTAEYNLTTFDQVATQKGEMESFFLVSESFTDGNLPDYDFIFFDCPPALGMITTNVLLAADYVFVPLDPMKYALDGMVEITKTISSVSKRGNPNLKLGGVFFTSFDGNTTLTKAYFDSVKESYGDFVMDTKIRRNVALREAPHVQQPLTQYAPDSNGVKDYSSLAAEMIARVNI